MKRLSRSFPRQTACHGRHPADHTHEAVCTVSLPHIAHNAAAFQRILKPGAGLCAVIKADGYGHGAEAVAQTLQAEGVNHFGVATVNEGAALRQAGITADIILLMPILAEEFETAVRHGLVPSLSSVEDASHLNQVAAHLGRKATAHLMVDTGMSRGGFQPNVLKRALPYLRDLNALNLNGLWTHFATLNPLAAARDTVETFRQLAAYAQRFLCLTQIHMANSQATCALPESHFDLVRPGLGLYGYLPGGDRDLDLKPAMQLTAPIIAVNHYPAGKALSYEGTHVLSQPAYIGTVKFGYADGYHCCLSNKGQAAVRNGAYPLVGRIMMDQLLVNLGETVVSPGEQAILLGPPGPEAPQLAEAAGMPVHAILTAVGKRVRRVHLR